MRLPICGGNWNNGANAGVFNVNLNNPRSNSNSNIGFRSALLSYAGLVGRSWTSCQCERIKEPISTLGSNAGEKSSDGICGEIHRLACPQRIPTVCGENVEAASNVSESRKT